VRPDAVILVELEVWPNFLGACRSSGTPVGVVNGRIGAFSRRALGALSRLLPRMWEPVRVCCARSEDDAGGFVGAGLPAERVFNCGSLKYDALPAQADAEEQERLRRLLAIGPGAPVLVAGSTHPGEESVLVRAYRELREEHRGLRLILAPRHVERGGRVAAIVQEAGLPVVRKSELDAARTAASGKDVIVVDTLGDLLACYSLATCAFVGRSLIEPGGGQNVMEPAALGKPVLVGPHTGNFKPDMALLMARGAVSVVRDAAELGAEVQDLLSNPSRAELMGRAGRSVVEESRGATGRTLERLEALFGSGPAGEPTAA
jgi:3-deoxy-D-manno-octulosonic-acid transferase